MFYPFGGGLCSYLSLERLLVVLVDGMLAAIAEGIEHVQVESDNWELVTFLSSPTAPPLVVHSIVENIHHFHPYFLIRTYFYIPREINSLAESLARQSLSIVCLTSWSIASRVFLKFVTQIPFVFHVNKKKKKKKKKKKGPAGHILESVDSVLTFLSLKSINFLRVQCVPLN